MNLAKMVEDIYNYDDDFYLHVAKMFYAVAYIDGMIRTEEIQELECSLRKEWVHRYQGSAQVVNKILKNFHVLKEKNGGADKSFQEFVQYKKENEALFRIPIRNTLWEVSCAVADIVHKKNKSELILLVHLGKHLGIMK